MRKRKFNLVSAIHGGAILQQWSDSADAVSTMASALNDEDVLALEEVLAAVAACDDLSDEDYQKIFYDHDVTNRGLDAAELLAHKHSVGSLPSILRFFCWLEIEGKGEMLAMYGPSIIGNFGREAIPPIMEFVLEERGSSAAKCVILEGITKLVGGEWSTYQEITPYIIRGLGNPRKLSVKVNSQLMMLALDGQLADAAEVIERAFSANRIDCGMAGDWEELRKRLHVEGLGLPMPAKPINTQVEFKRNVGVGAFSQEPLHILGELQDDAVAKYLETACRAFARSTEARTLSAEGAFPDFLWQFLDVALNYLGVNVENMTAMDAEELLLGIFPRKVSMDPDETDQVIDELVAFWRFCDRIHDIENASSIARKIEKLRGQFRWEMTDSDNFGMAKSFFMAGVQAGYDMTTQEGIDAFASAYNQSLSRARHPDVVTATETANGPHQGQTSAPMSLKKRKKLLAKLKKRKKK